MRRAFTTLEVIAVLAVMGIVTWLAAPKLGIHLTKTPAQKAKAAEIATDQSRVQVLGSVQQNLHEGNTVLGEALRRAPSDRLLTVMDGFFKPAQLGIDQLAGSVSLDRERQWQQLALGLISENAEVRASAERQHEKYVEQFSGQSKRLSEAQLKMARLERDSTDYAIRLEAESARSNWLLLGCAGLGALILFGGAPVTAFLFKARAEASDLSGRVGTLMGRVRTEMPHVSEQLRAIADEVMDDKHKSVIGEIADDVHAEALRAKAEAENLLKRVATNP